MFFEKTDKRRLYWLIDLYLAGKIDANAFCNEYHECYGLELDSDTLTELESKIFSELNIVAGRFSNIAEDLEKYPGTYFTEEELKQKIIETKELLKNNFMQDISIEICKENQETVERSNINFLDIFMAQTDLFDHPGILPWIETIDPHGTTILNELQVIYFIKDMGKLKILIDDEKVKKMIDEIVIFAQKVIDEGPHRYLKFIGD